MKEMCKLDYSAQNEMLEIFVHFLDNTLQNFSFELDPIVFFKHSNKQSFKSYRKTFCTTQSHKILNFFRMLLLVDCFKYFENLIYNALSVTKALSNQRSDDV